MYSYMASFQVNARGAQDQFLTSNPQETFWRRDTIRYSPYAIKEQQQTFLGSPASGGQSQIQIQPSGDLLTDVYITVQSTANTATGVSYGNVIQKVELEIGSQSIVTLYGDWMVIWRELTTPESQVNVEAAMSGTFASAADGGYTLSTQYYRLPFWFCLHPAVALPIGAMSFHKVYVNITWGPIVTTHTITPWASYVFLSEVERDWFVETRHQYIITQVQRQVLTGTNNATEFQINFNQPVKELIMYYASGSGTTPTGLWANGCANVDCSTNPQLRLTINGNDREQNHPFHWYSLYQPRKYHTRTPVSWIGGGLPKMGISYPSAVAATPTAKDNVFLLIYSFCLAPEDPFNPNGSLNFSRVSNASLNFSATVSAGSNNLVVFAPNWNVAQVMGNMFYLIYNS